MKKTLKTYFWLAVFAAIAFLVYAPLTSTFYEELEKGLRHLILGELSAAFYIFILFNAVGICLALLEGLFGLFNGGKSIWNEGSIWNG